MLEYRAVGDRIGTPSNWLRTAMRRKRPCLDIVLSLDLKRSELLCVLHTWYRACLSSRLSPWSSERRASFIMPLGAYPHRYMSYPRIPIQVRTPSAHSTNAHIPSSRLRDCLLPVSMVLSRFMQDRAAFSQRVREHIKEVRGGAVNESNIRCTFFCAQLINQNSRLNLRVDYCEHFNEHSLPSSRRFNCASTTCFAWSSIAAGWCGVHGGGGGGAPE